MPGIRERYRSEIKETIVRICRRGPGVCGLYSIPFQKSVFPPDLSSRSFKI